LSTVTADALAAILPSTAAVTNPVDLAGAGERDLQTYSAVVDLLLASDEADSVILSGYFGGYGSDTPALAERELDVVDTLAGSVRRYGRPVVVHSMSHDSPAVQSMRANAVPTLHTIDGVARSLRLAVDMYDRRELAELGSVRSTNGTAGGKSLTYLAARDVVAACGIAFPCGVRVGSVEELRSAAVEFTAPFVLKAGWVEHKTEVGGVAVGLADVDAAVAAFREMAARLGDGEYVLEEMDRRPDVVELVVGARRDRSFGPLVLVGVGGVQAELYRDVEIALAPVSESDALDMLANLRGYPLLQGWRGRPPVDVLAAARTVAAVSLLLARDESVVECEINPLRVGRDGALAVDALVVAVETGQEPPASMSEFA
jgi:acyl-CoA synthetase (NDP forming)